MAKMLGSAGQGEWVHMDTLHSDSIRGRPVKDAQLPALPSSAQP